MNQRTFGKDPLPVSEIGLGCWQLGGADWGEVSERDALAILQTAVDSGVTFFDTADVYGLGRSEQLIGRFLAQCPAPVTVATKIGRFPDPGWPENFNLDAMRRHVQASCQRLGVDALDLVQLHCLPTEILRQGDVFGHLRALRAEGLARRVGLSIESVEEALLCLQRPEIDSLQVIFNLFRQKLIPELFDRAKAAGVALIVRLPLASGLLTGKFTKASRFAETDHRSYNRDGQAFNVGETFAGLRFGQGVELADHLRPLVPAGMTMTQFALRWILDFDAVSTVIPGAKSPEQVAANVTAAHLPPLSPELHQKLRIFYETAVANHIRGPY